MGHSEELDQLCINTIRFLAVDAVEKAQSGHPGLPLGASPMAYVLWDRHLRFDPRDPSWFNRDRFVLSAGHGCAMLYALLHLYGFDLSLDELRNFRQWGSRTPGHPEYGHTPGVEATTGPLGQGVGNAVGFALAERTLGAWFNRPEFAAIDFRTYALVSDGDLMEGIASEACSFAGHQKLHKLTFLYDDNRITIDGKTDTTFTENVGDRFAAYGWNVLRVSDGNSIEEIDAAIQSAKDQDSAPSLIMVRTVIGFGSPKQDTEKVHGAPLGGENRENTKKNLGWPLEPDFFVPDSVSTHCRRKIEEGHALRIRWEEKIQEYTKEFPDSGAHLTEFLSRVLPNGWSKDLPNFQPADGEVATRDASHSVLNAIARAVPTFLGGSADLAESNKTDIQDTKLNQPDTPQGRNIRFGVREHAMGAIVNGLSLCHLHAFGATFLIFSDYMRAAIRLSALMQISSTWVFSHDSVFVGEDGPTHQPIEQLMSLRAIPGLTVLRPADANETTECWKLAIELRGPKAILLTRQKLPVLDPTIYPIEDGVRRGAYVLSEAPQENLNAVIIATGSEVHIALESQRLLAEFGIAARVVSMPSWELFRNQTKGYRESVLPRNIPRVSVEAGVTKGWREWVLDSGEVIGVDDFGHSAPGKRVYSEIGFTPEAIVATVRRLLVKGDS